MRQKNLMYSSDDLKVSKSFTTKVKTVNVDNPKVLELVISFVATPNETLEIAEYEGNIKKVNYAFSKLSRSITNDLKDVVIDRYITDFNFSAANLKKDYQKQVTMSLFLRQKAGLGIKKISTRIKKSCKSHIKLIEEVVKNQNFRCMKTKTKYNS